MNRGRRGSYIVTINDLAEDRLGVPELFGRLHSIVQKELPVVGRGEALDSFVWFASSKVDLRVLVKFSPGGLRRVT